MKKVLFINSRSPYPVLDGAAIGTLQYLRLFHDLGYEVDLLYISEHDNEAKVRAYIGRYCHDVIPFRMSKRTAYLSVLKGLFTNGRPLQVNYYYSKEVRRWVEAHAGSYDILYCHNIRTAQYVQNLPGYKILNIVDAFSMNYQAARRQARGIWYLMYTIDSRRCARYEQRMLDVFDKKLIVSEVDRDHILAYGNRNDDIAVIENYTEGAPDIRVANDPQKHDIVFVGSMSYEANITAVKYFCHRIMPALISRYPDVRFYIVGKEPTPAVTDLQSEHVVVTGFVSSIWDYVQMASVVVTPMLSGSGIQNKILQALSVGACVVTTSTGFAGLKQGEGQPFIADGDEAMIEKIAYLLDHPEVRKAQEEKSIAYIRDNYSVDVIRRKFADFLNK